MNNETKKVATKFKVRNPLNYHTFPFEGEKNFGKSMTVPDEVMSMRTIIEQHSRGITFDIGKMPVYNDNEFLPDIRKMDLSEIQELKETLNDTMLGVKAEISRKRDEKLAHERAELDAKLRKLEYYESLKLKAPEPPETTS